VAELIDTILRYLPVVIGVVVILGPIAWFQWRLAARRYRMIDKHRTEGTIGPAGFVQGADLPRQYDALARLGTKGEAPRTLDDRILRPSAGVRLLVAGLAAAVALYLFWPGLAPQAFDEALHELPVPPIVPEAILLFAAINGVFYIFGFEARYNNDLLITTRMFLLRREYRWRDLDWIGDDGAYELHLRFHPGGKAKVLKHCRGIEDFKRFAQGKLSQRK
jgi:hypothetical protein